MLVAILFTAKLNALDVNNEFIQNINTANSFGYVNYETEQFETYCNVKVSQGNYTSIASKIYKPLSGDTLIVVFHGNGEGGVNSICNNYAQLAGNRLAVTYTTDELQRAFKGAYALSFQAQIIGIMIIHNKQKLLLIKLLMNLILKKYLFLVFQLGN